MNSLWQKESLCFDAARLFSPAVEAGHGTEALGWTDAGDWLRPLAKVTRKKQPMHEGG